jgi:hypothetical protein
MQAQLSSSQKRFPALQKPQARGFKKKNALSLAGKGVDDDDVYWYLIQ